MTRGLCRRHIRRRDEDQGDLLDCRVVYGRADALRFLGQAEPVFEGLSVAWNGKSTQGLPHLGSNMKCSYSYFKVGQYETIAGYEHVRQGNVFVAGEHCSFDFQGFMEGAGVEMLNALGITATA